MTTFSVRLLIINLIFIDLLHAMEHEGALTTIAAANAYTILTGHTKEVKSVVFSPTNNTGLVSASLDTSIRLWNTQTAQCLAERALDNEVWIVCNDDNTNEIVTIQLDNEAWAVRYNDDATDIIAIQSSPITKEQPSTFYMDLSETKGFESPLKVLSRTFHQHNLAFGCEDGYMFLTTFGSGKGAILLNNPVDNGSTSTQNGVWSLAYSPDGKNLATGTFEKIYIWNNLKQDPQEPAQTLNDNDNKDIVKILQYKDDTTLISGSSTTLKLWDIRQQKPVGILQSSGKIISIAYAPNDQHLANGVDSSTANGSTEIWDLRKTALYTILQHDDSTVASVAYSPNETQLACGQTNGNITVWNLDKTTT